MIQQATDISAYRKSGIYFLVNTIDPTRTLSLRNRFVAKFRSKFSLLMRDIREAVIDLDVLALEERPRPAINAANLSPRQFDFPRSDRKIEEFVRWLASKNTEYFLSGREEGMRVISGTLSVDPSDARQSWMTTYIDSAYQQGIRRAQQELKKAGIDIGEDELNSIDPVRTTFNTPMNADRVGLIYTRAYSSLKGITTEMESIVSDVLATGIADGRNPRTIAAALDKMITGKGGDLALTITDKLGRTRYIPAKRRAEILARTEVIRAHHSANIGAYKSIGIEEVEILAEHLTAGDSRVCPICAPLAGKRYTLEEAEYKIPVHPQCRCVVIPYIEGSSFN